MASAPTKAILPPSAAKAELAHLLPPRNAFSSVSLNASFSRYRLRSRFLGLRFAEVPNISALHGRRSRRDLQIKATVAEGARPTVLVAEGARPTVLVAEKLGEAGLELLRGFANVDCSYKLSPEELCAKISLCDALIVRSGTKVTREVFEAARGRLKVVGRAGVGIDNVDLQAATEHGCLVVNAPTANTVAAAEHGIALIASMARKVAQADASMKAGKLSSPPSLSPSSSSPSCNASTSDLIVEWVGELVGEIWL